MAKRALVIGSQTGGLRGVHNDVEVVAAALGGLGFATVTAIEADASRRGILERYRGLVEDARPNDAVVVYYSGHGGRQRNALAAADPSAPAWLHYILPTDIDDRSEGVFRGILAQELSCLQLELTGKTANVTTILDCCHSARMSRDPAMLPKAQSTMAAFPWEDVGRRLASLRDHPSSGGGRGDDNPLAVRVVACSPDESAFELAATALGGAHGALTSTLVPVLLGAGAASLTWRSLLDLVRPAVMDIVPQQRPEVEGPLDRLLFSTEIRSGTGVLPVVVQDGSVLLLEAGLFGMAEGDTYDIVGPGADPSQPLATAVIERIEADRARLRLEGTDAGGLPPGCAAHPVRIALGARPVAVVPGDHPGRSHVVDALGGSPHVRLVDHTVGVVATVRLEAAGVRLLDAAGEPLQAGTVPMEPGALGDVAGALVKVARATHVRELASGAGPAELPDDVAISYSRVLPGGAEVDLPRSGGHLFAGDRVVIRFRNGAAEKRYVSVLDVGISGAISVQTTSEPDGVTLAPGECYELGRDALGALEGLELYWPDAVPALGPRPETMVAIVSDAKVDNLKRLEQAGVTSAARRTATGPASALELLVEDLDTGRRDARPSSSPAVSPTRYLVRRFDFVFHPQPRGPEVDEPPFELDERPDASFHLVVPRGVDPPGRVAVRLTELVVHSNRAFLAAAVRIDAVVVTVPPEGSGAPYTAATARFDRVKDGDRLPFDNLLVYEGPVGRFVDLAVWVAKDDQRELDLADLLSKEGAVDVKGAVATLTGLAVAAPHAAALAGGAAAVATIIRTGARLLDAVQGRSIGVYRTSLLPHQRFGAGPGPARTSRHPTHGLIAAQDMSFAFEVVDLDQD